MNPASRTGPVLADTPGGTAPGKGSVGPFGIYFGWYNVALALACIMVGIGSTSYSFGLFIKPASAELGLSRANTNLGLILFHLGSALASPFMGRVLDRFPLRRVLIVSACSFAAGMIVVAATSSPLLIGAMIIGPIAFGIIGLGSLFGIVLVSRWFTDQRGRAISIMALGTSLGGMVVFPLVAFFMASFGWRGSLVAVAGLVGSVVLAVSFLIRPRPDAETAGRLAQRSVSPDSQSLTQRQILAERDFWFISIAVALMLGVDQSMLATVTPYMLDRGMSLAATASIMSALTASAIAGKIVIAWIADRSDLRLLLAITGVFGIIQCVTLTRNPTYGVILAVSLLTGLAVGGTFPLGSAIMAQRFGAASVGSAIGLNAPFISGSAMAALYFVGASFDRTGSYTLAFMVFAGVFVLAICILPFIRKHAPAVG